MDNAGIEVIPEVAREVKKKLKTHGTPDSALRLGVRGGGCTGFAYIIAYEDDPPRDRDIVCEVEGVRFIVDPKSLIYMRGSVLTWRTHRRPHAADAMSPSQ